MPIVEQTETIFELHEPDEWYAGTIKGVEETQFGDQDPGFKFLIRCDGDDRDSWLFTSQKYSDFPSKLWMLAEAMLGSAPERLDTDDLIGRRIDIMFAHGENDGKTKERIDRFRASKTAPAEPLPEAY